MYIWIQNNPRCVMLCRSWMSSICVVSADDDDVNINKPNRKQTEKETRRLHPKTFAFINNFTLKNFDEPFHFLHCNYSFTSQTLIPQWILYLGYAKFHIVHQTKPPRIGRDIEWSWKWHRIKKKYRKICFESVLFLLLSTRNVKKTNLMHSLDF